MLHYLCNTTCYHIFTVLLHSLDSQNIILFTTLLYSIYSVNFTIFHTLSYYCTESASIYYHNSLFFFLSYISIFCTFLLQFIPYTHDHCPIYHFFCCCKISKSIDSIYSLNTFLCFVISSNLLTGHFFLFLVVVL